MSVSDMRGGRRSRMSLCSSGLRFRAGRLSGRNGRGRFRVDRGAIELGAALVPHAYPASALAQLGSGRQEIARQLVRGFRRTGGILERQSAGVENNVAVVEQIKIEQRHSLGTIWNGHG